MSQLKQDDKEHSRTGRPLPVIDALRRTNNFCLQPTKEVIENCTTNKNALVSCIPPGPISDPEAVLVFRRPVPIEPVRFFVPEPGERGGIPDQIGCLGLFSAGVDAVLAIDLLYEQRWCFQNLFINAIATTITLAPNETLRLTIRNSQRKLLDQSNIDEVERSETTESLIVDREVINITRSSSNTENWNISGNASVSIPIKGVTVGLGVSGGFSQSTTEASQSSSEKVSEATQKSANNLRSLQKVEVKETVETVEEQEHSRVIVNPYRDRSLSLNVYNLGKEYRVDFALTHLQPSIILEFNAVTFDRNFVIANGDFLQRHLRDTRLRFELADILETTTDNSFGHALQEVERLSELALRYLFDVENIFNVDPINVLNEGTEANTPASSFDATRSKSGLEDAVSNKLAVIFTTMNYYFKMYQDEATNDEKLKVSLALSLEAALRPRWLDLEETEGMSKVMDEKNRTEAFRRLGGFLALVSGSIRPLLQPAQADQARLAASRRAEFVIQRTVDHLHCHMHYYICQYLYYLSKLTGGLTIKKFAESTLESATQPTGLSDHWEDLFSVEEAFVDRNTIVIPGRCRYDRSASAALAEMLDGDEAKELTFGILHSNRVLAPADGAHIEPSAGACILPEVPESATPPLLRVSLGNEPLQVTITNKE